MNYKKELLKEINKKGNEMVEEYPLLDVASKKERLDYKSIIVLMSFYQKVIILQGLVQFYNRQYKDKMSKKVEGTLEKAVTEAEKAIKEGLLHAIE